MSTMIQTDGLSRWSEFGEAGTMANRQANQLQARMKSVIGPVPFDVVSASCWASASTEEPTDLVLRLIAYNRRMANILDQFKVR